MRGAWGGLAALACSRLAGAAIFDVAPVTCRASSPRSRRPSLACRLDELVTRLESASDLGRMQAWLVRVASKGRTRAGAAEEAHMAGSARKERVALVKAARPLAAFLRRLGSRAARRIPAATVSELRDQATHIRDDLRALAFALG